MIFTRKVYTDETYRQSNGLKQIAISDMKDIQLSLKEGFAMSPSEVSIRIKINKILEEAISKIEIIK